VKRSILVVSLTLAWLWISGGTCEAEVFRDVVADSGIAFRHKSAPEKKYILESMAGGLAILDFNNDGLMDIYFVNALTVETAYQPDSAPSALYKNLGGLKFEDVTEKAGLAFPGWGMGVCTADIDGDSWQDVYVTTVGPDKLYRNQGDGTFEDITEKSGLVTDGWSTGCGFADYDKDGDLDLFVARYVEVNLDSLPEFGKGKFCSYGGVEVQCGPRGLPGTGDLFFRNRGDETFEEVAAEVGVDDPNEYFGLGISWFDFDADGWQDLFVANDAGPNFLYHNKGDGTFEDMAFPMGVAVSEDGAEQGCMGVAVGDYLNEGRLSIFVTNFSEEYNALYYNNEDYFTDLSFRSASAPPSLPYVSWGTNFFDYDNDGWQDIVVVSGHVYPQLETAPVGASAPYRQRKTFYRNKRDGTFEEIADQLGSAFVERKVSRGMAIVDLDNDGRLDMVISDLDGLPQILHNEVPDAGNWLRVKLAGKGKLTDAIGAVVTARVGDSTLTRLIRSGSSYISQEDKRLHFGLGEATGVDRIEVLWPDGTTSQRDNVEANQQILIEQE
jgi:hypothetical protein